LSLANFMRFKKDVRYDLLVPPLGLDFYNMTPKQAKENFEWFISKMPERMEYFRSRCASDLNIPEETLNYSPESLILVWRWFLQTARMEKTPQEELERMKEGAKVFGDSFINWEQFTVATKFIMRDIGMYVGQCYVLNYPILYWHYHTKPKNGVDAKQPLIYGFVVEYMGKTGDAFLNPIRVAEGAAANFYYKTQKETDVYDMFVKWAKNIPQQQ
jgi:hypothetical protein